jgi:antitoxin component of MazEF toxin-antitoxin module
MKKQTYAARFTRLGGSGAMMVPKDVQEQMGLIDKDLVIMRVFGKLLIARRVSANDVVDVSSIPTDAIPSAVRS